MAKQSIFGRISTLVRANINSMLDSAEDPQKMLDQLVRDYTNNIADAESAIAETIGNLRLLERDHEEDVQAADGVGQQGPRGEPQGRRAARGRQHRGCRQVRQPRQDRPAAPDQRRARGARPPSRRSPSQTEVVDKLKDGLNGMKQKLEQLKTKRSELLARAKTAEAQNKVHDAVKSIDVHGPDQRARPLRGQGPSPGGPRRRQGRSSPRRASTRSSRASKTSAS